MRAGLMSALGSAARSYVDDVRRWMARATMGYVVAVGLMLVGAVSIIAAIAVGLAAGFHFLAMRYGIYAAYGIVGGSLFALGLLGLLAGRALLSRPLAPVPRPHRQVTMVKRQARAAAPRLLTAARSQIPGRADPISQALAAAAALTLVGWIVASRNDSAPKD